MRAILWHPIPNHAAPHRGKVDSGGSDSVKLNFVQGVVSSLATSLASVRVRFENGDGLADMGIRMARQSVDELLWIADDANSFFNFTTSRPC